MFTRSRLIFIPVALILFFSQRLLVPTHAESGKIDVIFRYDDYSATSQTQLEKGILDVFLKYRSKITIGVIPFVCERDTHDASPQSEIALTSEKTELLKDAQQAGIVEVALHGYSHQTAPTLGKHYSEFKGVSPEKQSLKMSLGKKFLEQNFGVEVSTFVPPWNSYDHNTVLAAQENHFKVLSGDFEGTAGEADPIQFIPATSDIHKARGAVQRARWNPGRVKQTIVILFHEYDFKEADPSAKYSLDELSALVSWMASQRDVRMLFLREAAQEAGPGNFDTRKYLAYKKIHKIIPGFVLELMFPVGAFSSVFMSPLAIWGAVGASALAYGVILFFGCRMFFKIRPRSKVL